MNDPPPPYTVKVSWVADSTSCAVTLDHSDTLRQLHDAVAHRDPFHVLRFIFRGCVLVPEVPLHLSGLRFGSVVLVLRTGVSLGDRSDAAAGAAAEAHAAGRAFGFERLVETGFSENEVIEFRAQFHGAATQSPLSPAQLEREESWIRAQGAQHQSNGPPPVWHRPIVLPCDAGVQLWPISSIPSHDSLTGVASWDTVICLVVGFLLPWLPVLLMFALTACDTRSTVPRTVRAALVVGAGCNVTLGFVRSTSVL